jgi:hypothetical protein
MGGQSSHSKYDFEDYVANPPVISAVTGGAVHLYDKGSNGAAHAAISYEGARFFARSRLS